MGFEKTRQNQAGARKRKPKRENPQKRGLSKPRTPAWLRRCRERLDLTQERLADLLSLDPNTIYRKERTDGKHVAITHRDEKALVAEFERRGLALPR